jgi:hypothetical protein
MFGGFSRPFDQQKDDEPDCHYEVSLLPWEREKLLLLLEHGREPTIRERRWLCARVKDAICRDGKPLPPATLDWRRAEKEARERGESVPDYIWDHPLPPAA